MGRKEKNFKVFALTNLFITSTISAIIVAKIKKGGAKAGIKFIPFFILIAVILFLISIVLLNNVLKDIII